MEQKKTYMYPRFPATPSLSLKNWKNALLYLSFASSLMFPRLIYKVKMSRANHINSNFWTCNIEQECRLERPVEDERLIIGIADTDVALRLAERLCAELRGTHVSPRVKEVDIRRRTYFG